ncbi:MAG: BrnA antitoxin family protein [Paracoccaceae bacterium]|nr:MAG: BrnA antitoxin family protein [Paracoccaceae bacterium]
MPRRTPPARRPARQAAHYAYMADVMRRLEWDLHNTIAMTGRVPAAWHEIARAEPHSATVKVTLRLEADVVKFLKSMGEGWGPRANDILKSWMHARLAGVIRGAETVDYYRARTGAGLDGPKPRFGATAREFDEEDGVTAAHTVPKKVEMIEVLQARYATEGEPEGGLPDLRVK